MILEGANPKYAVAYGSLSSPKQQAQLHGNDGSKREEGKKSKKSHETVSSEQKVESSGKQRKELREDPYFETDIIEAQNLQLDSRFNAIEEDQEKFMYASIRLS